MSAAKPNIPLNPAFHPDAILQLKDPSTALHLVVQKMLYENAEHVQSYEAPAVFFDGNGLRSFSIDYLAFMGRAAGNPKSGRGNVRQGYGYAYVAQDGILGLTETGIIIPNVRALDVRTGWLADPDKTFRHHHANQSGVALKRPDQIVNDDVITETFVGMPEFRLTELQELAAEFEHPIGVSSRDDNEATSTFKSDVAPLVIGTITPVEPRTHLLHKLLV